MLAFRRHRNINIDINAAGIEPDSALADFNPTNVLPAAKTIANIIPKDKARNVISGNCEDAGTKGCTC